MPNPAHLAPRSRLQFIKPRAYASASVGDTGMPAAVDASMLSSTSPHTYFSCTGRLNNFRPKLFSKDISHFVLKQRARVIAGRRHVAANILPKRNRYVRQKSPKTRITKHVCRKEDFYYKRTGHLPTSTEYRSNLEPAAESQPLGGLTTSVHKKWGESAASPAAIYSA